MIRTRDFILLFSAIMFLLMAIGTTLIHQGRSGVAEYTFEDNFAPESADVLVAQVVDVETISRAERIAQMRAKIAKQVIISEPEVEEVDEDIQPTTTTDVPKEVNALVQCSNYTTYGGFWDARNLSLLDGEGARVLVRGDVGSTSISQSILQLPVRTLASGNPSCVGSDVIGIANDGSLIRNDEVAVYRIFDSSTVIGYALDGFPIYGGNTPELDTCGGTTAAGQYAYYLSAERDTVVNCFASVPIVLP